MEFPRYDHQASKKRTSSAIPRTLIRGTADLNISDSNAFAFAWVHHQAWDNSCMSVQADRAIRTGKLNSLLRLHTQPIDVVVFHGSRRDLVLRLVSRLDAFSGYLVRT